MSPSERLRYQTHFGNWLLQVQSSGNWGAGYQLACATGKNEERAFEGFRKAWTTLDDSRLPRLHSVEPDKWMIQWLLPPGAAWSPLVKAGAIELRDVERILRQIGEQLESLHRASLAAFDLSPNLVFVDRAQGLATVLPTLGLADFGRQATPASPPMAFAAPEVQKPSTVVDPVRADVYAFGCLAWHLLTKRERTDFRGRLPSEIDKSLAPWDAFIDGCCRSVPGRRFGSVRAALATLGSSPHDDRVSASTVRAPVAMQAAETNPEAPAQRRGSTFRIRRRTIAILGLCAFLLAAISVAIRWGAVVEAVPGLSAFSDHERGFGDSIVRYRDRSYEGAKWVKVKESKSLASAANIAGESTLEFQKVTGWDDDDVWFSGALDGGGDDDAGIFKLSGGHWSFAGRLRRGRGNQTLRLLDRDTAYFAGDWATVGGLWRVSSRGVSLLQEIRTDAGRPIGGIATIAPDLCFFFHQRTSVFKVAGDRVTEMRLDKYKETYLHARDNTPDHDCDASRVELIKGTAVGQSYAVFPKLFGGCKLGRFENGLWYDIAEITTREPPKSFWVGGTEASKFFVLAGDRGWVHFHRLDGEKVDQPVAIPQENTSRTLILVWGASADKYWVMDTHGTVWERSGEKSRVVVRGLNRDGVEFVDAWASPRGTVFAITREQIYRLE
jgi:hypothetical protein